MLLGATALATVLAAPAQARAQRAESRGSLSLAEPVGTGIAVDTVTAALTSIFLSGQAGNPVSLLMPTQSRSGPVAGSQAAIVVLSSTSYDVNVAAVTNGDDGKLGNLLYLAQFN
jgi:hypothetical protein